MCFLFQTFLIPARATKSHYARSNIRIFSIDNLISHSLCERFSSCRKVGSSHCHCQVVLPSCGARTATSPAFAHACCNCILRPLVEPGSSVRRMAAVPTPPRQVVGSTAVAGGVIQKTTACVVCLVQERWCCGSSLIHFYAVWRHENLGCASNRHQSRCQRASMARASV